MADHATPHRDPTLPPGMQRLLAAATAQEIADGLAHCISAHSGCRNVAILRTRDGTIETLTGDAADDDAAWACAAPAPRRSADGSRLTHPLAPSTVALLEIDPAEESRLRSAIALPLQVAGTLLTRTLQLAELTEANAGLVHSEQLQRALFAIADLAGSERDMADMLREIHAIVATLMYAENFFIVLHDGQRESIRFLYFADVEDTAPRDPQREIALATREHTLTWYLVRDGKPLMGDTAALRQQVSGPLKVYGPDGNDWLGVPMLRDGEVRGALVVQSYEAGIGYDRSDMALLAFVGSHILTALERKRGKVELEHSVQLRTQELADANQDLQRQILERQRAERLQAALFHIAALATADISQAEFYRQVHAVVGTLLNARNFFIALLVNEGTALEFPYAVDENDDVFGMRPLGRGATEYVLRHGKTILRKEDMKTLAARGEMDLDTAGTLAEWWLGVPLQGGDEVIGLVAVQSYSADSPYNAADQELLAFVASQIGNTLNRRRATEMQQRSMVLLEQRVEERTRELRREINERERIQEQLKHQVMHDGLTGLPNRGYLLDRLERVLGQFRRQPTRRYALLYLDIDRFKVINDSLGHLAGDEVLKAVTRRLQGCVRDPDIVARLAGDEFAILLEDVEVPGTAIKVAQRVIAALGAPLQVAGKELEPSASIGIALADARYQNADEVLRDADQALYRAKALGRKRFELFDATQQKTAVDVLAMEGELRVALQRAQFEPYFQPVVDLAHGTTVGYEALIRWNHPSRGVLAPGAFMRIAEDNGSIEEIDWHMFEASCRIGRRLLGPGMRVGINVSPLHLRRAGFGDRLLALVAGSGLEPGQLVVEITEGSLLDDPERVGRLLDRLREAGIDAALDDFGTGYSSLSYLHNIPLRTLKIDRAFVARLGQGDRGDSATIVSAVLAMARALGIHVVAEGIETPQQRDTLLAMGCELGQGYLLGRPAPVTAWPALGG